MLETLDLSLKMSKTDYLEALRPLGTGLMLLQRAIYENGLAVLMIFEGWEAAGKGESIARLVEFWDPRGFKVHTPRQPNEEEAMRPRLWRFWNRIPPRGTIAIFDRSWYNMITLARLDGELERGQWDKSIQEIRDFERQLTDSGVVLIKFWLQISAKECKRRTTAWSKDPLQQWRRQERYGALSRHRYKDVLEATEDLLAPTNTPNAPWILVESENDNFRRIKVLSETAASLCRALEDRQIIAPTAEHPHAVLQTAKKSERAPGGAKVRLLEDPLGTPPPIPADSPLARVKTDAKISRARYEKELEAAQNRLRELEFECYVHRCGAAFVFEGWDAAGKGGAIKRLTERLDPRGYNVVPIAAPTSDEARRHYLWRFWREIPKAGHLAIFDRSWYGRVMVERVEGFCSREDWRRAYHEINEFERALADGGIVLAKFWLHISVDEQWRRFQARAGNPMKQHKITEEDLRNRAKWPAYLDAVSDMLRQTSTAYAPWTIVEANDKLYARLKVLNTAIQALEQGLKNHRRRGKSQ